MEVRLDRPGAEERLAEPDEALVGVHLDEEQVRELAEADRVDPGYAHAAPSPASVEGARDRRTPSIGRRARAAIYRNGFSRFMIRAMLVLSQTSAPVS